MLRLLLVSIFMAISSIRMATGQLVFLEEPRNDTTVQSGQLLTLNFPWPGSQYFFSAYNNTSSCSASINDTMADIHYQWLKDGQSRSSGNSTLEIVDVQCEDAGLYVCVASTEEYNITSKIALIEVQNCTASIYVTCIVIIAVSTSVGGVVVLLTITISVVGLYLCLRKCHPSSKAPHGRDHMERTMEEGKGLHNKRSKSLTQLLVAIDEEVSISKDNPLYKKDEDEQVDGGEVEFDLLNLDESLFEQTPSERKTKTDRSLLSLPSVPFKPLKKVRSLPEKKRKGKKRYKHLKRDDMQGEDTASWPRKGLEEEIFPEVPSTGYRDGRRSSAASDGQQSDTETAYEFSRSQNSSVNMDKSSKSVRFEIEVETEVPDSGHVTGNSTPYDGGRRSSEQDEYTLMMRGNRRSSAPECKTRSTGKPGKRLLETVDSESYLDGEYDDEDNRVTPSATSLDQSYLAAEGAERYIDQEGLGGTLSTCNSSRSIQTVSTMCEAEDWEEEPTVTATVQAQHSSVPIAQLISTVEQWKDLHKGLATAEASKLGGTQSTLEVSPGKVIQMRTVIEGRKATLTPNETTLERRSKQMSRLVTETTKQLFPEPPLPTHQMREQLPADSNNSTTLTSTLASRPQAIPSVDKPDETETNREGQTEGIRAHNGASIPLASTSESVAHTKQTAPHNWDTATHTEPESAQQTTIPNQDTTDMRTFSSTEALLDEDQTDEKDTGASKTSIFDETPPSSPLDSPSLAFHRQIPVFSALFSGQAWKPSSLRGQDVAIPFSSPEPTDDEEDFDAFEMGESSWEGADTRDTWNAGASNHEQDRLSSGSSPLSAYDGESGDTLSPMYIMTARVASVSPMGRGVFGMGFGPKLQPSLPPVKSKKKPPNEAFFHSLDEHRQPPSKRANRLTAIPEEGLEANYSATDILQICT